MARRGRNAAAAKWQSEAVQCGDMEQRVAVNRAELAQKLERLQECGQRWQPKNARWKIVPLDLAEQIIEALKPEVPKYRNVDPQ